MIVAVVVIGLALVLCVAGWVPVVRDAVRVDHVLPGPPVREAARVIADLAPDHDTDPLPESLPA